jgi:hypothetical protein
MDGTCDVPGCTNETYMGWQPLTESRGKQICEQHWTRHKDPNDDFDVFDVFGFRRPAAIRKPMPKKDIPQRAPEPGRVVCMQPVVKPELPQDRPDCHEPAKPEPQGVPAGDTPSGCKACGAEREAGHTYCQSCAQGRKRQAHQQRQKRYREKHIQAVKA